MDDLVVRSRYARNNMVGRKRRKSPKADISLPEIIFRQIIICLAILVIVGLIKSINTPVTNYLSNKFKTLIFHDTNFSSIYKNFNGALDKIGIKRKSQDEEAETPTGANLQGSDKSGEDRMGYDGSTDDETPQVAGVSTGDLSGTPKEDYGFMMPVDGIIASGFGNSTSEGWTSEFHTGIDIEAENGSPVRAALDGEVVFVDTSPEYNKYIEIAHGDGLVTIYAHCFSILAESGQKVRAGDIIAEIGNADVSVGSHLHFEVMKDEEFIDPMNYLKVSDE